ncbi:hypothetical protein CHUAL_014092 [Chamberlinius hualienensis]
MLEYLLEIALVTGIKFVENELIAELLRQPPKRKKRQYHTEALKRRKGNAKNGKMDFSEFTAEEFKILFRFEEQHIKRLTTALGIPHKLITSNRCVIVGSDALCVLLRRLASPNRLSDLENLFGLSASYISTICNTVMDLIVRNRGELLTDLNHLSWLNKKKLGYYSQIVEAKGAPLKNCWGFLFGATRGICRPTINEEEYYSELEQEHCLKYLSILCPDGIIASLQGPYPGRTFDADIFKQSGIYQQLESTTKFRDEKFVLYGKDDYPKSDLILKPYSNTYLNADEQTFNDNMSSVNQAVEWGFEKVLSEFAFLDFKPNQKFLLQNVSSMYKAATLLTNCHTCLYGCETAQYFDAKPPVLEDYLS